MLERFQGAILGLAIGDALGRPVEFLSRERILARYGPQGITDLVADQHPAGTFTDDTQMTIALAEGLLETLGRPLDERMTAVADRFVAWSISPDNVRAPGNTCLTACHQLARGARWDEAGVAGSKGCGSVMRVAPVGLLHHRDRDALREVADAQGRITHGHRTAVAASVAAALAVSLALDNTPPREILESAIEIAQPIDRTCADCLSHVTQVLTLSPETAYRQLGDGWIAEEALAGALYAFCRTPDDYRATVLCAANTTGDSDSFACLAGAISGAYNGLSAIPEPWREQVEAAPALHHLATRLHTAWSTQTPRNPGTWIRGQYT